MAVSYVTKKSKPISIDATNFFLSLSPDDITLSWIKDNLIATADKEAKYNTYDYITLDAPILKVMKHPIVMHKNFNTLTCTIGCFITNLFLFTAEAIRTNLEFVNKAWDKDVVEHLNADLVMLLIDKKIGIPDYREFLDKIQWQGLGLSRFFVPSFDIDSLAMLPEVRALKDKLLKDNAEALQHGDTKVALDITNQCLAEAKRVLEIKKPVGYELFKSGVAQFGNHYKNVSVMRGILPKSSDTAQFNICTSALSDGIKRDEIHKFNDLSVLASFSRAVGTQNGGYLGKMFNASFQHCKIAAKGSDCKTTLYTDVFLTKENIKSNHLRYIVDPKSKELVCLTLDNMYKYIDKNVKMRSPLFCKDPDFCNKCMGDLYYNIGVTNVGLLTSRVASKLLNASLKFFHNTTVKTGKIELNSNLLEVDMEEIGE